MYCQEFQYLSFWHQWLYQSALLKPVTQPLPYHLCSSSIIIISDLHHYECIAPLVTNSLQSGKFWARLTVSVHDSPWESRSFCTVFIQVICGHAGGLFQYTEGELVKICLAFILSSIQVICPNRVRCRSIISVSRGWLVWRQTLSLEMKWYHLMPRSIERHHWWRALILRASSLVIAQHSDPYRKIGNIQVL